MYHKKTQMEISDFVFPFGNLDQNNRWVKLAAMIPWEIAEENYAKHFVDNGHPAHSARCAYGALIIKQTLGCSDKLTVTHVEENPYLQFFLGEKGFTSSCPFGASTMVDFRKRISETDIAELMEAMIPKEEKSDSDDEETPSQNKGELLLDATCCPANIKYPQDINLLNRPVRELQ